MGRVEAVAGDDGGSGRLQVGDWVVPSANMDGTWTTHMITKEDRLIKVSLFRTQIFSIQFLLGVHG